MPTSADLVGADLVIDTHASCLACGGECEKPPADVELFHANDTDCSTFDVEPHDPSLVAEEKTLAKHDPKGKDTRSLVGSVLNIINLSGIVPYNIYYHYHMEVPIGPHPEGFTVPDYGGYSPSRPSSLAKRRFTKDIREEWNPGMWNEHA
jgi:hypothetical protein